MDLNWLRDFVCLGRTLNFTKAANERNITQPAFSRRIKSLENWMGVPLIDRDQFPLRLTPAGEQFLGVAADTITRLTETRSAIRLDDQGQHAFQRFAVMHTISLHYLSRRISEFEKEIPDLRTRVISDNFDSCRQLLLDGNCEFMLYYRHQNIEPRIDETPFERKDIGVERIFPVAQKQAAEENGWVLSPGAERPVPYLSYDPTSFLGTVVDLMIEDLRLPLDVRYIDTLAETMKRRALSGSGVAWLPEFSVTEELERGDLIKIGTPEMETEMIMSLFGAPSQLDPTAKMIWDRF